MSTAAFPTHVRRLFNLTGHTDTADIPNGSFIEKASEETTLMQFLVLEGSQATFKERLQLIFHQPKHFGWNVSWSTLQQAAHHMAIMAESWMTT